MSVDKVETVDYADQDAVESFGREVETTLDERARTKTELWSLIGMWLLAGVLLTLGYRFSSGILYVLGVLVVIAWVVGLKTAGRDQDFRGP